MSIEIINPIHKKTVLLFVLFLSCFVNGYSQDEKRDWYDPEANLSVGIMRPYYNSWGWGSADEYMINSQGGWAYGLDLKNSFLFGKWFTDLDVNVHLTQNFQQITLTDEPEIVLMNHRHWLTLFSPYFSAGRFFKWNDKYRISVGAGMGYSWLLPKADSHHVRFSYDADFDVSDIYEYDISYWGRTSNAHATIGLYLPVGSNELVIKISGRPSGSVGTFINMRKIENYEAVELFETSSGLPQRMISISVGYRFCGTKNNKE